MKWLGQSAVVSCLLVNQTANSFAVAPVIQAGRTRRPVGVRSTRFAGLFAPQPKPDSFLVGNISAAFKALFSESKTAVHRCRSVASFHDLAVILLLALTPNLILKGYNDVIRNKIIRCNKEPVEYDDSWLQYVGNALSRFGQLGILAYIGELILVYLSGLGVPNLKDKPKILASLIYGCWFTFKATQMKTFFVDQALQRYRDKNMGKIAWYKTIYSRAFDVFIYLFALLWFVDSNNINVGVAIKSLMTLGGVSSVVVGLALKEPVAEIIQGTSILLSNKFSTGDVIRLSDGTAGTVQDLKWTDIQLRGHDGSFVRIPNTHLAKNRVVNLSRMPTSQFREDFKLPFQSNEKVDQLICDIKDEIRAACPKLCDNDVLPFRVHWTDFDGQDSMVVTVDCHFTIKRLGTEYWDNRQHILEAVSRAIAKNKSP